MGNKLTESFFNLYNGIRSHPALLIPQDGSSPLVGIIHSSFQEKNYLLTKAMVINKIGTDEGSGDSFFSYDEIDPKLIDPNDYVIEYSQEKIDEFLKYNNAIRIPNPKKKKKSKTNSINSETLKNIGRSNLILIEEKEGKIFYLGFPKNPIRDLKKGAHYLTLNDVLTISKKPSPLEGTSYEWLGFDFTDNGITYNTINQLGVPLKRTTSVHENEDIIKKFKDESKRYKPLKPVKEALDYIILGKS